MRAVNCVCVTNGVKDFNFKYKRIFPSSSGIEASYEDWYIKPYKDPAASEKKWAKNEELEPTPGTVNFFLVGLQVEFEMHSIF